LVKSGNRGAVKVNRELKAVHCSFRLKESSSGEAGLLFFFKPNTKRCVVRRFKSWFQFSGVGGNKEFLVARGKEPVSVPVNFDKYS
jgi:hypothetical protein